MVGLIFSLLSNKWAKLQKTKELDFGTLKEFESLYGEFFAIYHLWDDYKKKKFDLVGVKEFLGDDFIQRIVEKTYTMEGNMEALLVRIAVEKDLSDKEIDSLGKFRQGFQRARKHVCSNEPFNWNHDFNREYASLKIHSSRVSDIILFTKRRKLDRKVNLLDVTSNRYETEESCSWLLSEGELSKFKSFEQRRYEGQN